MRSAFALRIFSGRIILNFGVQNELPQSKPVGFASSLKEGAFGMAVQFPAQPQSVRVYPFRLAASRQATFPKGTALAVAGNFAAAPKGVPVGELAANVVSRLRGYWGNGVRPLRHRYAMPPLPKGEARALPETSSLCLIL